MNPPARVFISCSQQKDTEEVEIARQICSALEKQGYQPYIAVEQHSLVGVTEDIFDRIAKSEYFLFIDFRQDGLNLDSQNVDENERYCGSLFSHQELAIASFLRKNVIAFKEQGVRREGISSFIMANASEFSDRKSLPKCVVAKVKEGDWSPEWRDELSIDRNDDDKDTCLPDHQGNTGNYFHVKVKNMHKEKVARNCVAFVSKIRKPDSSVHPTELVELKWKGVKSREVSIPPGQYRRLDVFHTYLDSPSVGRLGINPFIVDFTGFEKSYQLSGAGQIRARYCRLQRHIRKCLSDLCSRPRKNHGRD